MKHILKLLPIFILLTVAACDNTVDASDEKANNIETLAVYDSPVVEDIQPDTDFLTEEYLREQYAVTWLVVADSGDNYYALRELMFDIHHQTDIPIDTMDRYFDTEKRQIILSDTIADFFTGEYFPRRHGEYQLSIEHTGFYHNSNDNNTMMLIAGIFHNSRSADSLNNILREAGHHTYILKTAIFMGCML